MVEHVVRLDILGCLDVEPLTIRQLSARIGADQKHLEHHLKVLGSFDLVGKAGDGEDGQDLYVARIEEQPGWVARAVNARRQAEHG